MPRWTKVAWVLWMASLPACLAVPTNAKWKLSLPSMGNPIAVGGSVTYAVQFEKQCDAKWAAVGGFEGCLDPAEAERRVEITNAQLSPSTPFSVRVEGANLVLQALDEGRATLSVAATSRRVGSASARRDLRAARATELRVVRVAPRSDATSAGTEMGCVGGRTPARLWFPAGEEFTLLYRPFAGSDWAMGLAPAVSATGAPGFRVVSSRAAGVGGIVQGLEATYVITEPGATFSASSPAFAGFGVSGGAYTCQTLTGLALVRPSPAKTAFDVVYRVGDDPVCAEPAGGCPVVLTSETPGVCQLVDGERARPLKSGLCRISAVLEGTPLRASLEFSVLAAVEAAPHTQVAAASP